MVLLEPLMELGIVGVKGQYEGGKEFRLTD